MILGTRMAQDIQDEGPITKVNLGRLTNTIFVFTLLLLFGNIWVPTFNSDDMVSPDVLAMKLLPDIMNFLIVFIIIAMIWITAYHTFHMVARIDRTYLYLHLGILMMLVLLPISSHYTEIFATKSVFPVLFHSLMLVLGTLLFCEWYHISCKHSVLRAGIAGWRRWCITVKMLIIPVTAVVGIVLAACDLPSTQYIYLGAMAAFFIMSLYSAKNLKKSPGVLHD